MSWLFLQAAGALAMLYLGGEALVRGASGIAALFGVSALTIGLTVVAFGTSAPELVVSLDAALSGANDISVGNVVGSNIANIALILGAASLICPATVQAKLVRIDMPIMIAASLGLLALLSNGTLSRLEGALLLSCLLGYAAFTFWEARREGSAVQEEFASASPGSPTKAWHSVLRVVAGLALLAVGGRTLVNAAVDLAGALGVSQAVIGLTIVAVGTSLPELATSVIASLRRQGDIAVGNVVGSNIFNILGILGVTSLVRPLQMGGITWIDLSAMVALAFTLALMLLRGGLRRTEGAVLFACFVGYTGWLLAV